MRKTVAVGALSLSLVASMAIAPVAFAREDDDQEGKTTLEETITTTDSKFKKMRKGKGERYVVRKNLAQPKKMRQSRRESLTFFGQLTDPQLADEMSPARLELIDPVGGATSAAWRPQEALGPFVFDSIIRNMNANKTSRVRQGDGKRARLEYALLTGDIADSQQYNEVGWFRRILNGGVVDPFSGQKITAKNPCTLALGRAFKPGEIDALNQKVNNREYTGVQDFDDWPGQSNDRYNGFWDPDRGGLPNSAKIANYDAYPKFPGLMDRAQRKFKAEGLDIPWYITRGNHDTLIQGNVPANTKIGGLLDIQSVLTGCQKPWPNDQMDPSKIDTSDSAKVFDQLLKQLNGVLYGLNQMELVPPDSRRRSVSKAQFKQYVGKGDNQHGFDFVAKKQQQRSNGNASYYAFNKGKFRIIVLDTNAEGGGASGNLDDPQYKWLAKQLDRYSTIRITKGKVRRDSGRNKMMIITSHHTLETMDNSTPDEAAGTCKSNQDVGCDSDPRLSTPLHYGVKGKKNVLSLLKQYPNVIAYVNGHTHHNKVRPFKGNRAKGFQGGFWQVNTASHVDWPQQSRTVEIMDNRDQTLSIFGTILNSAASVKPPKPGTNAANMSNSELAALSRQLGANDPQRYQTTDSTPASGGGLGKSRDRNVELILKDPRMLWGK